MVMPVKVRTSVLINGEILKKAQELGLNVSQACENALRLYINAMENANQQIAQNQTASAKREGMETVGFHKMAGPVGFEPTFSGSEGRRLNPFLATGPFLCEVCF
jgi:post-segregation antitoxin (ccd killing protein)